MSVSVRVVKRIVFYKDNLTQIKTLSMLSQLVRKIAFCVLPNVIFDLSTLLFRLVCSLVGSRFRVL
jgi:hypothetical protein